jgi:hypothetical protein
MSGSAYGVRAYGRGRYSRYGQQQPSAMPIRPASTLRLSGAAMRHRALASAIVGSSVAISGMRLWEAITVAPCQQWPAIGRACCGTALPNRAGSMFP